MKKQMKKDDGFLEQQISLLAVILAAFLIAVLVQLFLHQAAAGILENALAASNLASAVIDLEEYGSSGNLVVTEPEECYQIYSRALKDNLGLDEEWTRPDSSIVSGQVQVYEYSLYEVRGEDVTQYTCAQTGGISRTEHAGGTGKVAAPDGTVIHSTSVYSRIGFPIRFLGLQLDVRMDKCVDVWKG